ncbi:hypothetical protein J4470_01205 [Candidatus Woesearchaeota archaeon]|nr:hypothetical protein [Candidatus Woesearchaeota archaeon]
MAGKVEKKRPRHVMRKSYFGFGILSLLLGMFFLSITVLTAVTAFRILVVGFFVILGIIDLAMYSVFRER